MADTLYCFILLPQSCFFRNQCNTKRPENPRFAEGRQSTYNKERKTQKWGTTMAKEIEYEAKSMLSEAAYRQLTEKFGTKAEKQQNDYYDTADFTLKSAGAALRVRRKKGSSVFTLKAPANGGLLETHQPLTKSDEQLLLSGALPEGEVQSAIKELIGTIPTIRHFGSLTTYRMEAPYKGGVLCLDHSVYAGTEDYEIEYEGQSLEHAESILTQLLAEADVPFVPAKNKVARFYEQATQ